ncbi:MAG: hypothetical protein Q8P92_03800 [Candidatus Daviesbacteria bacterium]|nr:hypothetical protein [Candidatus Daviesbacteria bacterium]
MLKKINPYIALIFLIPLLLSLIWFKDGRIMAGGESGLLFHDPQRKFELSQYSWSEIGLGSALRNGVTAAPIYWVFAKMNELGLPNFSVQAIYFYFLFVASGLSIYFLTKTLFPKIKPRFLFISTLFYWFNLFSLVNIWNRFLYDFMSLWTYLPLAILLFVYGIKNKILSFSILLSLSSVLFSFGLSNVAFLLLFWVVLFSFFIFFFLSGGQKKFTINYFLITLTSFVFFNFWWISHAIFFRTSSFFGEYISGFFSATGNLDTLSILSEQLGNIFYSSRLMHGTFFTEGPIWANLYKSLPFSLLTYLPPILIIWVVFKFRKNKEVIFLGLFIIFLLFLIKGTAKPLGEIFEFFFINIPLLQVFRNPFEKFGILLPLCFSPLIAFGLSKLNSLFAQKNQTYFYLFITFYIILISFPFWTNLVFNSHQTQVPYFYKEANAWLRKDQDLFRLMVFPIGGEGINQTWEIPYSGIESSNLLFDRPAISFNTSIPYYSEIVSSLDKLLFEREDFAKIATVLNVKYLLLRKDNNWQKDSMRDPEDLEELFQKHGYQKISQFGNLIFYNVGQNNFKPKIWASTNLVEVRGITEIEDFFLSESAPGDIIYSKQDIPLPGTKKVLIKPKKVSFFSKIKKYTPKEALDNLPYAKYLPDHPIYPLIQLKESFERTENKDTAGKFLYELSNLGKKVAEIYGLSQKKNIRSLEKSLDNYLKHLTHFENEFADKVLLSPQNQFSNLLLDSLMNQRIIITQALDSLPKESKEKYQQSLDNQLTQMGILFDSFSYLSDQENFWVYSFNLSEAGDYRLVLEDIKAPFLVDGKTYSKTNNFYLKKGNHELVIFESDTKPIFLKIIPADSWNPPQVTFEKINSTKFKVKVSSSPGPFLLVFSELYSSGWQFLQDGKALDEKNHLLVNSFANGWFLEKGDFEGVINYYPQNYVNLGYKISLISIGMGILTILVLRKKES